MTIDSQGNKVYHIGAMLGNVYTAHPKEIIHGIYCAASRYNVNLDFFLGTQSNSFYKGLAGAASSLFFDYQFNTVYDFSKFCGLDALIISYGTLCIYLSDPAKDDFLNRFSDIPRVVLEERAYGDNTTYIISDNYNGMAAVVEHLITVHNCRHLLHISGPGNNTDANERKKAFKDTLEKFRIPYSEDLVLEGDYTQYIDREVALFLKKHPDADAICAANDDMAVSACRAIRALGKVPGVDIAVTGYDNAGVSMSSNPMITTVEQNGYEMGFAAFEEAMRLCEGREPKQIVLDSAPLFRESCGCKNRLDADKFLGLKDAPTRLNDLVKDISGRLVYNKRDTVRLASTYQLCHLIISFIVDEVMNKEDVTPDMDYYFNGLNMIFSRIDDDAAIENNSYMALQKEISRLGAPVIANEENPLKRAIYVNIMTYLHMYFNKLASRKHEIEFLESSRQAWVGPLFVREMVEQGYDEQNFFFYALKGLIRNGAKSAYILIYDKPIKYEKTDNWTVPDKLYLAAYYNGVVRESYEPDKRPVITVKDGIGDIVTGTNRRVVTYSLFDQDNQYGILMCECDESGIFTAYITSLQLSISIHFLEINKYKHEVEASLNDALSELEKKNQVLEFVSNSDPLTGLMNRRGLVEQALDRIKLNEGKRGYAIFADLDHLKQINDTFGHAEGDKAITAIADLLKENSSEDALIARIGGDEYLILDFDEDKLTSNPVDVIKNAYYELNKNSDLPYYIEASLGMTEFICRSGMKISDLLNMSDEVMYEAKKFRRSSVIK